MTTSVWRSEHVGKALDGNAPIITDSDVVPIVPGLDLWDLWPVRSPSGAVQVIGGLELWIGLSAPALGHPVLRHDVARLRLLSHGRDGWHDHGTLFPDGASLGSREWAGCSVCSPGDGKVTVYYTAAGIRGEPRRTYAQRIAVASGYLTGAGDDLTLVDWDDHRVAVWADGIWYADADDRDGEPGFITAFRDPSCFRDPVTGSDYLLFTGSLASARTSFSGAIGLAAASGSGRWTLLPPLLHADGVNNELERPHIVFRDGRYYLFFSTQRRTFHPDIAGPTGLYGFVAPSLNGPYEPLNGSGLVLRNPADEPHQAYSWLVLDDLRVVSFVDSYGLGGKSMDELEALGVDAVRARFGGTIAPVLELELHAATTSLVGRAGHTPGTSILAPREA